MQFLFFYRNCSKFLNKYIEIEKYTKPMLFIGHIYIVNVGGIEGKTDIFFGFLDIVK